MPTAEPEQSIAQLLQLRLGARPAVVARVAEGGSTEVYRAVLPAAVVYVRLLPEQGASLMPEALAHRQLRARGVPVPGVLYVAHVDPLLGRSVMVTSELPGRAMRSDPLPDAGAVLRAAGGALAQVNALPVQGWGWIRRDQPAPIHLEAEHPSCADWLAATLADDLRCLVAAGLLDGTAAEAVQTAVRRAEPELAAAVPRLAHGDFDPTHMFHVAGRFTGIIDWGEMRGAHPLYDLGHFAIENGPLLPALLDGYLVGATPTAVLMRGIALQTLLVALRRLARRMTTGRAPLPTDVPAVLRSLAALFAA